MWHAQEEMHSLKIEVIVEDHMEEEKGRLCGGQETIVEVIKG